MAEVYAWAPGQVVKLFRAGIRRRTCVHEARMTRAAFAAGLPAPEVFDEVTLDERFGIVMSHLVGPTLMHLSRTGTMTFEQVGVLLATLAIAVHKTPPPREVISLRDHIDHALRACEDPLPEHITNSILPLIDQLSPGDGLCHADLHSGNVIMTAEGPRLIDWTGAVRAPPAYDLGVCQVLLNEIAPALVNDPARPRAINRALQSEYARLTGLSPSALRVAVEPYLTIARVSVLLLGSAPALRAFLIERVEMTLPPGP